VNERMKCAPLDAANSDRPDMTFNDVCLWGGDGSSTCQCRVTTKRKTGVPTLEGAGSCSQVPAAVTDGSET
jgi:hypothetical protein